MHDLRIITLAATAAALALTACDRQGAAPSNTMTAEPAGNAAAPAGNASAPAPAPAALTLAGDGLQPGVTFGMTRAQAEAAVAPTLGAPTESGENEECGAGPMEFVNYRGLTLHFLEGGFVGWSLRGADPALRTAGGLGVGAPRSALGTVPVDEESNVGPEFEANGVGGILDEQGARIETLFAGNSCQFR